MCDDPIQLQVREALKDAFRIAEQRGITQATLHRRTGFSEGALSNWATGKSDLDLWRFVKLTAELPDEAASLVFECVHKALRTTQAEGCFDELAAEAGEYQREHIAARNDNSP